MPVSNQQTVVALFVRCPVPGRVKTRLARNLGDEVACALYRAIVADIIANIRVSGLPLFLFHDTPDADRLPTEWVAAADRMFSQEGVTLGERMNAAFERSFAAGAEGLILTGSDIPGIDASLLLAAGEAIENHAAVFSPAFDGGYCLVASKKDSYSGSIFREIPWSTPAVMDMTVAVCTALGLSCHLLPPRRDIDTLDDLIEYCGTPSDSASTTNTLLTVKGFLAPSTKA
jgi:rSAM/selenodomain-associated transferase 1